MEKNELRARYKAALRRAYKRGQRDMLEDITNDFEANIDEDPLYEYVGGMLWQKKREVSNG